MSEGIWVAEVGIDSRAGGSDAIFTYKASAEVRAGEAFFVSVGNRQAIGFVLSIRQSDPSSLGFDVSRLKPLGEKVHGFDLPESVIGLVHEVALQTLCSVPVALSLAVPPGARERLVNRWTRTDLPLPKNASVVTQEAWNALEGDGLVESRSKPLSVAIRKALLSLRASGHVASELALVMPRRPAKGATFRLTSDSSLVERFIAVEAKRKPAQAVTLMKLQGTEQLALSKGEIRALAGVTDQVVKALIDAKLLEKISQDERATSQPPTPNPAQQAAIDAISEALTSHRTESFLLYGITGSGKTEVYLRCAELALRLGRPALYLLPEIALTAQVVGQLRARFGDRVAVMHSSMSASDRLDNWMRIRTGVASVVVGARSALFAPLAHVGLIIMDEEHEASYKQESSPRYHTRPMAMFLAEQQKCPLVLGSATPSIESFVDAREHRLTLLSLPQRAAAARLPAVEIVDLRDLYKNKQAALLSPPLHQAMEEALGRGEQVMLFLNRRAYAPFVVCRDCGNRFMCPNCAVALSFHLSSKALRCHHCDFSMPAPELCPKCGGNKVGAFGVGVEKVAESAGLMFPGSVVERLDRDVARHRGALEDILARFRSGEINILVGTQMIAKGLDFPNVTVVGVVTADISLSIPDFRSSERTFQLLTQVAGRAGRGQKPGKVVIQTFSPDHVSVVTSMQHDFEGMFEAVSEERKAANYPPFCRLVNVVLTSEDRQELLRVSGAVGQRLKVLLRDATILGPVDCPLSKLKNMYRRHLLIKLAPGADVSAIAKGVDGLTTAKVKILIDIDPYTLS